MYFSLFSISRISLLNHYLHSKPPLCYIKRYGLLKGGRLQKCHIFRKKAFLKLWHFVTFSVIPNNFTGHFVMVPLNISTYLHVNMSTCSTTFFILASLQCIFIYSILLRKHISLTHTHFLTTKIVIDLPWKLFSRV